ncbi:UPF0481 protein At3g47200 [Quercus suber]|uniref:UPF0481 protein At3g47200 n=1 Tax=Quercus suber TaxID=58331 RepID=UPI0032DE6FC6
MEMLKLRHLKEFCYRTGTCHKDIASTIEANELKIHRCYDENFDISSEDFVNMVVLDSIFIIELFLRSAAIDALFRTAMCGEDESDTSEDISIARGEHKKDCISCKPLLRKHIAQDLLLLENQLPFFIIDKLHSAFSKSEQNKYFSFLKLSCNFLFPVPKNDTVFVDKKKVKHFTDLMRYLFYPSKVFIGVDDVLIENLPNATKLDDAGMIFRKAKNGTLLDIEFKKSILIDTFPCLTCSWL